MEDDKEMAEQITHVLMERMADVFVSEPIKYGEGSRELGKLLSISPLVPGQYGPVKLVKSRYPAEEYVPGASPHVSFKCSPYALGGFFDLGDLELTPKLEEEPRTQVQEAEIVASCPPPPKTDKERLAERVADLLKGSDGVVRLRPPADGARCYVCDHPKRGVAPSRVSGVLLCPLCAEEVVADPPKS